MIDHEGGNLVSVRAGLERAGAMTIMIDSPEQSSRVDGLVLPGVGASRPAMTRLRARGFDEALRQWSGPLLGICLGMQLLFDGSDEQGGAENLGLLRGRVRPLPQPPRTFHIGWNEVHHVGHPLFAGIEPGETFYFVHSLAAEPADLEAVIGTASYPKPFAAAVSRGPVAGVQFHPERSGRAGMRLLANFVAQVRDAA